MGNASARAVKGASASVGTLVVVAGPMAAGRLLTRAWNFADGVCEIWRRRIRSASRRLIHYSMSSICICAAGTVAALALDRRRGSLKQLLRQVLEIARRLSERRVAELESLLAAA